MAIQKLGREINERRLALTAALTGITVGTAGAKYPFSLFCVLLGSLSFLWAPEVLGFFSCGGLYLAGRSVSLGLNELFVLNVGSFLLPLYFLVLFLLLRRRAGALAGLFRCGEFWAVLGLGLLLLLRLPDSLFPEYGWQKVKYYAVNNLVCFFAPVLAAAAWGASGLYRFLKGVFFGGLALTAYFWLSKSFLDLPFNPYAVLNFNPIGLSRLMGLFVILVLLWNAGFLRLPLKIFLAGAAGAAMILLDARGPALALIAALAAAASGLPGGRRRLLPLLAMPLFLMLAVYICTNFWFSSGFFSLADSGRLTIYLAALAELAGGSLLGAGTGSFASLSPVPGVIYPHNLFLETAVELGLPGLVLSLLLVLAPLARLKAGAKKGGDLAPAGALLVFGLINAMLSSDINGYFILWLAAGVAASLAVLPQEESP